MSASHQQQKMIAGLERQKLLHEAVQHRTRIAIDRGGHIDSRLRAYDRGFGAFGR